MFGWTIRLRCVNFAIQFWAPSTMWCTLYGKYRIYAWLFLADLIYRIQPCTDTARPSVTSSSCSSRCPPFDRPISWCANSGSMCVVTDTSIWRNCLSRCWNRYRRRTAAAAEVQLHREQQPAQQCQHHQHCRLTSPHQQQPQRQQLPLHQLAIPVTTITITILWITAISLSHHQSSMRHQQTIQLCLSQRRRLCPLHRHRPRLHLRHPLRHRISLWISVCVFWILWSHG